uniref:Uncharacterized protein n=1 Tax=Siphoviridae sp. ct43U4 TaxID=2826285 RepID=A0A8S5MZV1_9CAUD|nr:MAG TPA: hypothetical protein [Siphoviridae sp. ct43U4]
MRLSLIRYNLVVSVKGYGWVAILGITRGDPCFL